MKLIHRIIPGLPRASGLFDGSQQRSLGDKTARLHRSLAVAALFLAGVALSIPVGAAVKFGTNLGVDFIPQAQVINDYGASGMNCKTLRVGARANKI